MVRVLRATTEGRPYGVEFRTDNSELKRVRQRTPTAIYS